MVYTSSPTSISHLKAAAPIRLIKGGVILPKNLGSGSPRKGNKSLSELEAPMSSQGPSVGSGTCVVFSGVEEACGDNGHGGDITGGDPSVIGTSTDVDDMRHDTGATQCES